jgi:hypothetical protein
LTPQEFIIFSLMKVYAKNVRATFKGGRYSKTTKAALSALSERIKMFIDEVHKYVPQKLYNQLQSEGYITSSYLYNTFGNYPLTYTGYTLGDSSLSIIYSGSCSYGNLNVSHLILRNPLRNFEYFRNDELFPYPFH